MPRSSSAAPRPTAKKSASSSKTAPVPALGLDDYLRKILTSRVYDVAVETPLERARHLSERLGHEVWIKREDTQPVISFKLRGAYNLSLIHI